MLLRSCPFQKISLFSKILQPRLLSCSRAVCSDWLWRHIDVVTTVTHHQRCNAYWSAHNAAEEPGSSWGPKDQTWRLQAKPIVTIKWTGSIAGLATYPLVINKCGAVQDHYGYLELSYPRTFVPGNKSSIGGTFVPWNFFPGTFVPNIKISTKLSFPNIDYYAYTVHDFLTHLQLCCRHLWYHCRLSVCLCV